MALPPSGIVTVRLAPRDADSIDELVGDGEFRSRSDFIRYAIRAALDARQRADADAALRPLAGPGALPEPSAADRRTPRVRSGTRQERG